MTTWNPGAERFKGYKASEIIGQHFSRFYTEQDRAAGLPALALRTATQEGRFETEGWRVRKDGTRFWAHVLIDPIRAPSGELLGFAKVTRDLSERKAAEEAAHRSEQAFRLLVQGVTDYAIYMLDLEGRVTNWNAGARRIKGYEASEIVGQYFGRFYTEADRAAGEPAKALRTAAAEGRFEKEGWRVRKDGVPFWAHVVIDPIRDDAGAIIGFAKITRDITERRKAQSELDETRQALFQSQKLDAIGQLTGGVAHDFNNLLMAVLGSLELLRKRLPPDPKAERLLENAVQGAQRGAALTTYIPDDLPPALTDANQLEVALLNLGVNARDALPDGGRITIEATAETLAAASDIGLPAGRYVRLAVVDNGEGMDEAVLARATEPFYTTKGIGKGTGLGLPMVHGLAEQSGGRMTLYSRPGHGTRVDIWLPQADALGLRDPAPDPAGYPDRAAFPSCIVLAVDDDSLVLTNTAAMLEDLGHQVLVAASGAEALALLAEHPVDLVITDYAMPHMTGLQLAREIEASHPGLGVVLTTGYAELPPGAGEDIPRLAKPYSQAELARLLADLPQPAMAPDLRRPVDANLRL